MLRVDVPIEGKFMNSAGIRRTTAQRPSLTRPSSQNREIEAKFRVDNPRLVFTEMLKMRSVCGFTAEPSKTKVQIDQYFDSPKLTLFGQGASLRVRESAGVFKITLKTSDPEPGKPATSGIVSRGEREMKIDTLEDLFQNPIFTDAARLFRVRTWHHILDIKNERTTIIFAKGEAKIEAALDKVIFIARDSQISPPVFELEIENLSAKPSDLNSLVGHLNSSFALSPSSGSKYQRAVRTLNYA